MKKVIITTFACLALLTLASLPFARANDGTTPTGRVCNGGQCMGNGTHALDCPTSGGPTCTGNQSCVCHCVKDGSTYTPTNECGVVTNITIIDFGDGAFSE